MLCFSDMPDGPRIEGESLIRFHPGAGTETDTATVRSIVMGRDIRSDSFTFREWNFEKTRLDLQARAVRDRSRQGTRPSGHEPGAVPLPAPVSTPEGRKALCGPRTPAQFQHEHLDRCHDRCLPHDAGIRVRTLRPPPAKTTMPNGGRSAWSIKGEQPQVLEHEAPDRGNDVRGKRAGQFPTRPVSSRPRSHPRKPHLRRCRRPLSPGPTAKKSSRTSTAA